MLRRRFTSGLAAEPSSPIYAVRSQRNPPPGLNCGRYSDSWLDAIASRAEVAFDVEMQDGLLAERHAGMVDSALHSFIVHDRNRRALSPRLQRFVQVRSWQQDLIMLDFV